MYRIIFNVGYILTIVLNICCQNSENVKSKSMDEELEFKGTEQTFYKNQKQIADSLYEIDNFSKAILYFDNLIKQDSANGEYYFKRGYSNGMLLKRKAAVEDYLKSIKLKYRIADAYFNAGINSSFDNDSLALVYFKECFKISPDYPNLSLEIVECEQRILNASEALINGLK